MRQLSRFCGKQKVLWNYIRLTVLILPWFLAGGTGAGSGLSANLSGSFEEAIEPSPFGFSPAIYLTYTKPPDSYCKATLSLVLVSACPVTLNAFSGVLFVSL